MIKKVMFMHLSILSLIFCFTADCHAQGLHVRTQTNAPAGNTDTNQTAASEPTTNLTPAASVKTDNAVIPQADAHAQVQKEEAAPTAGVTAAPSAQPERTLASEGPGNNPLRKAARGAVNATLGWAEIPRQIIKENKGKKDIKTVLWGPVKGFSYFVSRTAVGIYEITTFLIPPYKPVVDPEFIFPDDEK